MWLCTRAWRIISPGWQRLNVGLRCYSRCNSSCYSRVHTGTQVLCALLLRNFMILPYHLPSQCIPPLVVLLAHSSKVWNNTFGMVNPEGSG